MILFVKRVSSTIIKLAHANAILNIVLPAIDGIPILNSSLAFIWLDLFPFHLLPQSLTIKYNNE